MRVTKQLQQLYLTPDLLLYIQTGNRERRREGGKGRKSGGGRREEGGGRDKDGGKGRKSRRGRDKRRREGKGEEIDIREGGKEGRERRMGRGAAS